MISIYLILVFLLIGFFSAFLSSILHYFSSDDEDVVEDETGKIKKLIRLKTDITEIVNPFIAIEILFYTAATIVLGAFISNDYSDWIFLLYAIIILFVITFLIRTLFIALGIRLSDKIAIKLYPIFVVYYIISRPFVIIAQIIFKSIAGKESEEASREELTAMVESAREEGAIDQEEYRILKNIMHFNEILVSDVMTPRTVVFSCDATRTVGEVFNAPELKKYSRFPIWEGTSLDDGATGYVMTRDILNAALDGKSTKKLNEFAREVYFIPENAELDIALDLFIKRRQHLFLVVDEYGGIEGLLTMEDVLETMLGVEIVDEADKVIDLRELAKSRRDKRVASASNFV